VLSAIYAGNIYAMYMKYMGFIVKIESRGNGRYYIESSGLKISGNLLNFATNTH